MRKHNNNHNLATMKGVRCAKCGSRHFRPADLLGGSCARCGTFSVDFGGWF